MRRIITYQGSRTRLSRMVHQLRKRGFTCACDGNAQQDLKNGKRIASRMILFIYSDNQYQVAWDPEREIFKTYQPHQYKELLNELSRSN